MLKGELWLLSCISHTTCQEVKATKPTPAYLCTSRNNALCAKLPQLYPILCDTVDHSPPGPSVHGILQARILVWVAISSSKGSSQPRDRTHVSCVSCVGRWVLLPLHHLGSPVYISCMRVCVHAKSLQSCLTLYDPVGCSCQVSLSRD